MAKCIITIQDSDPDQPVEEGKMGVDVNVDFSPEAPAIEGKPDMVNCTMAQYLAFMMLSEAQRISVEGRVTRLEGKDAEGERRVFLPDDEPSSNGGAE